ncbi:hypothetical protein NQZ68_036236, partial [Dissostichus eleginoides]
MAPPSVQYTIGGVKITFPCKAYPSQLAMMNSIIRGLNNGQHCLLESPTGSGKSLALLCSTLGWQQAQYAKAQEEGGLAKDKSQPEKNCGDCKKSDIPSPCRCVCHSKACRSTAVTPPKADVVDLTLSPCKDKVELQTPAPEHVPLPEESQPSKKSLASRLSEKFQSFLGSDQQKDDDFQPDRKRLRTAEHTLNGVSVFDRQSRKRQRLEQGVVFIDDDEPEHGDEHSGPPSWTVKQSSQSAALSSSCCRVSALGCGARLETLLSWHLGRQARKRILLCQLFPAAAFDKGLYSSPSPSTPHQPTPSSPHLPMNKIFGWLYLMWEQKAPEPCILCPCASTKEAVKDKAKDGKKKVPKIFFGTRTHKQITQIAHELKRTVYSGVPMTILSSRNQTCVHPEVAPHSNRNERCRDLLEAKDGKSCRYYHGVQRMRDQCSLQRVHGLSEAWDIEDIVALGKRLRSCPYYAARELMQEASIVFCPYNYLLDPMIRESMEIDLTGQIVVLDEAHNIEDCARESSSFNLDHSSLLACRDELDGMVNINIRRSQHEPLRNFCYSLINWIQESQGLMSERGYETSSKVWNGKDKNLAAVLEKEERVGVVNGKEDMVQLPTISSASSIVLKNLFMVLGFMFSSEDNCSFAEDYRVALQKSYAWTNQVPPDVPDAHGFFVRPRQRQRPSARVKAEVLTLSFWCLNPAVAFSDLRKSVHSIVLTSGTLSPMGSFSSELGVKFTIQLEANHVINKSQVWVGTIGSGPQGRKLLATFQHTEAYAFQDEVGALLLNVCQVVAKGVLCFLPSYKPRSDYEL